MKSKHPSLIKYFLVIFFIFFTSFGFAEEKGFVRELYRDLNIFDRLEDESRPKMINPREADNPFSHLVNFPIQFNTHRKTGPDDEMKNVLNLKPQVPFILSDDWYVLTKTDIPIVTKGTDSTKDGLGDITFTTWFSPINDQHWAWGAGPAISFPTATDTTLGTDKWSVGPSVALGYIDETWLIGGSFTNIWSVGGEGDREVNFTSILPVVSYKINQKYFLVSSPVITSNWRLDGETWTVPVGGGIGRIVKFDRHVVSLQFQSFYNVIHPDHEAEWTTRFQIQYFFPKKRKAFFEPK
ncbi:hypothetical protein PQO03_10915 [Lentisphaera profundi]|uniref:Neuromedin U n=1 Tax=Lentisphaera profundi TaxID=1658616 RepID=A0ABY7VTZ0_9BACT|nr:hypothetical protein [Lentisphaera profundi]WDE96219.1 hypothetical protein PQO03_10915 [Lentisphaera profundi]